MTLTEEQIAEIRARAEAATPGPWAYESVSEKSNDYCIGTVCPVDKDGDPGDPIMGNVRHHPHYFNAETGDFGEWYCEMVCSIDECEHGGDGSLHADARFIAHARTDIPALLSALEAQAAELAEVRQQYVDANEARIDAEAALAEARKALDLFEHYGCPICHGDCSSANPPVDCCPMEAARRAREGGKVDG